MLRRGPLTSANLGDFQNFIPSPSRPARSRTQTQPADAHFELHQHAWVQLAYCDQGLLRVTAMEAQGHTSFIVPPSRAVWIPANTMHSVTMLENARLRTVYMHASTTPAGWAQARALVVSPLLRELIQALEGMQPGPREDALMLLTLQEISQAAPHHLAIRLPQNKRLRALCDAVLRDLARQATLAEWTSHIGASERTIARLFRDELGTSYLQWRQQAVLAHALHLLARSMPVGQVAQACGYTSDSAFAAMFKAAMGHTPSQFQAWQV